MITTRELREALRAQESYAPTENDILADLERRQRPRHRNSRWFSGLLAAAAVAAIIGVTTFTGGHNAQPAKLSPTESALATSPGTSRAVLPHQTQDPLTSSSGTETAVNPASAAAARAAAEAAAAAGSAMTAAQSAQQASGSRITSCQTRVRALRITMDGTATGAVDGDVIRRAALDCAAELGGTGDLNVMWVDTTLQRFGRAIGVAGPRPATRVVVAQIDGRFNAPFGDGDRTISMLLVLDPAGKMPSGVQIPVTNATGGPIDLSLAGPVHH